MCTHLLCKRLDWLKYHPSRFDSHAMHDSLPSHVMGCTHSAPYDPHEALSLVVLHRIASYLLGVDTLRYSHASPALYAAMNHSDVWKGRIDTTLDSPASVPNALVSCCREKLLYLQSRALLFRGKQLIKLSLQEENAKWIPYIATSHLSRKRYEIDYANLAHQALGPWDRMTFELTFSLLPSKLEPTRCDPGVLVGFHPALCHAKTNSFVSSSQYFAFVLVNSRRQLLLPASADFEPNLCGPTLRLCQWYHLVLVVEGNDLRIFLDGKCCYAHRMEYQLPWHAFPSAQVGNGYSPDPNGLTDPLNRDHFTWWPFHGLMRNIRAWNTVLSEDEVCRLAQGHQSQNPPSLTLEITSETVYAPRVVSSQPCERFAEYLSTAQTY